MILAIRLALVFVVSFMESHSHPRPCILFLSTLLDALLTSVQWPFALCLLGHFFLCLRIYTACQWLVEGESGLERIVPAACFALNAISSSSMSFFSFFGAFKGLTLPPVQQVSGESFVDDGLGTHLLDSVHPF
jgi:hypothetical protein